MLCTIFRHALHDNSGLQYDVKQGVKEGMHLLDCFFDVLLRTFLYILNLSDSKMTTLLFINTLLTSRFHQNCFSGR